MNTRGLHWHVRHFLKFFPLRTNCSNTGTFSSNEVCSWTADVSHRHWMDSGCEKKGVHLQYFAKYAQWKCVANTLSLKVNLTHVRDIISK